MMNARALVLIIAFAVGALAGYHYCNNNWEKQWSDRDTNDANARSTASEEARIKEQADRTDDVAADEAYLKGLKDGQAKTEKTISDLDSGNRHPRVRFTCPPASPATLPKTDPGPGIDNAASDRGLRQDDGRFLIRFAGRCSAVARQLTEAQAKIRRLTGQP